MEQTGNVWNTLEATVSYSTWARLTPTLTHVVTYELVTSGAEEERCQWFNGKKDDGIMLTDIYRPFPKVALALTLTAVSFPFSSYCNSRLGVDANRF